MLLSSILETAVKDHPHQPAVACDEVRLDYSELNDRVRRFAGGLRKRGLGFPDRIAIVHRNCHHFLESYLAAAKAGAVLAPINYRLSPKEISFILDNSDSKALIIESDLYQTMQSVAEKRPGLELIVITRESPDVELAENSVTQEDLMKDLADLPELKIQDDEMGHLYYTSGTTGQPKGVVLTHRNSYIHAKNAVEEIELSPNDRWLHVSPMYHLADSWSTWAITLAGGTHIFVPEFNAEKVLETIQNDKATVSNFIPTMLNKLVSYPGIGDYDLSSFRLVMSGGAPIAPEIIRRVIEKFECDYIQTYGLTETSPYLTMSIPEEHLKGLPFEERLRYLAKAGRPFKGIDLKVVRDDGSDVEADDKEVGEIIAKGETITPGYWKLPEETEKRIVDGWLHTRDLATVDEEGYVTIVDRMDDMIITGGENVYSVEIENVLYGHPKVSEAAVIGLKDEMWGERIVAIIVPKDEEPTEDEIIGFCKNEMAAFKAPKQVILAHEIPKTTSGKIKKNLLRERYG
jgi:fatty-acyl-CoA synthase